MSVPGSRILHVDDSVDDCEMMSLFLLAEGYRVTSVTSVSEATLQIRAEHFDLYLIDSWLPDGTGVMLCQLIRQTDSHTPILFYSAAANQSDIKQALASGAQGYVVKPAPPSEVLQEINRLLPASGDRSAGKLNRSTGAN